MYENNDEKFNDFVDGLHYCSFVDGYIYLISALTFKLGSFVMCALGKAPPFHYRQLNNHSILSSS